MPDTRPVCRRRFSPVIVETIGAHIRQFDLRDSCVSALADVPRGTVSFWKRERPEFAAPLATAHAPHQAEGLDEVRNAIAGAGYLDWRARRLGSGALLPRRISAAPAATPITRNPAPTNPRPARFSMPSLVSTIIPITPIRLSEHSEHKPPIFSRGQLF